MSERKVRLPVFLQRVDAYAARVFIHVRMPYSSPKCGFRWTFRVILRYRQFKAPEPLRVRCAVRAGQEYSELSEIVRETGILWEEIIGGKFLFIESGMIGC